MHMPPQRVPFLRRVPKSVDFARPLCFDDTQRVAIQIPLAKWHVEESRYDFYLQWKTANAAMMPLWHLELMAGMGRVLHIIAGSGSTDVLI